jgi:uncharacterized protein (TIGR02147 family)
MANKRPDIYHYNDYRKYIADFQAWAFLQDRSYSKSHMTRLLGLPNSRSFLSDVLRGKRISAAFVERFIALFGFDTDEAEFFRALVRLNQCENAGERELYFEQLVALNRTPKRILRSESFAYYKDWYNPALRAILNVFDFDGENFSELAQLLVPSVSVPKIKKAFSLLLKLKLVEKNTNGFYKPTETTIGTEDYLKNEILRQFQVKCLQLAQDAIVRESKQPQTMAINTISISKKGLQRIEQQIEHFRSQVRSIIKNDEDKPDVVYQIDVLFFPMSK